MNNVICDKCGSGDVTRYPKPPKKIPEKVYKMSDIANGNGPTPTFIFDVSPPTMVIECQNCGYKLEYMENHFAEGLPTPKLVKKQKRK